MTRKKMLILFFIAIVVLFVLLLVFWRPISRTFKEKKYLSYENITYYRVISNEYSFDVRDNTGIEKITIFLNSLCLVEEEKQHDYEYSNPIEQNEIFYICIYGDNTDIIQFCREYITVDRVNERGTPICTDYYVVDSEYNAKYGDSKMINFLKELIAEYAE